MSFPIIRTIDKINVWVLEELPDRYERAIKHTAARPYKIASNILLVGGVLIGLAVFAMTLMVRANNRLVALGVIFLILAVISALIALAVNAMPTEYERIRTSLSKGGSAYTLDEDHPIYRAIMAPDLVSQLRETEFGGELSGVLYRYYLEAREFLPHPNPFDLDRVKQAEEVFSRDMALLEKARSFRLDLIAAKVNIEAVDKFWSDREKQVKATHESALKVAKQELERQLNAANRALG